MKTFDIDGSPFSSLRYVGKWVEMEKQSRAHIKDQELRTAKVNSYQKKWETGCAPSLGNYCSECWTSHLEQLATN